MDMNLRRMVKALIHRGQHHWYGIFRHKEYVVRVTLEIEKR